jgi:DNA-binding NtrC family response regulator
VNVRVIAATHRDLRTRASDGSFREDLHYRLAGYELHLPPLRERGRDVITLAKALLERDFPGKFLAREAQGLLLAHPWPNNIRELENVVRAAAIDAYGKRISEQVLRRHCASSPPTDVAPERGNGPARPLLARLRIALELASRHGRMTRQEYERATGTSTRTAKRDLADLVERGLLRVTGHGRSVAYLPGLNAAAAA